MVIGTIKLIGLSLGEFVQLFTLVISAVSIVIVVKTYKRNSKIELENHFFRLKMEAYSSIVFELESLFSKLRVVISDFESFLGHEETMNESRLLAIKGEIDKSIIEDNLLLTKYSIFFSDDTVQLLRKFTENLYGYYNETNSLEDTLNLLNNYYEKQLDIANKVNDSIREELKIERLNERLFKRY